MTMSGKIIYPYINVTNRFTCKSNQSFDILCYSDITCSSLKWQIASYDFLVRYHEALPSLKVWQWEKKEQEELNSGYPHTMLSEFLAQALNCWFNTFNCRGSAYLSNSFNIITQCPKAPKDAINQPKPI